VRYYFTVRDGSNYQDDTGYIFADASEAIGYAQTLAGELSKEPELRGSCIVITDDHGVEIARVAVTEAVNVSERMG
jgi:hypothetical protein